MPVVVIQWLSSKAESTSSYRLAIAKLLFAWFSSSTNIQRASSPNLKSPVTTARRYEKAVSHIANSKVICQCIYPWQSNAVFQVQHLKMACRVAINFQVINLRVFQHIWPFWIEGLPQEKVLNLRFFSPKMNSKIYHSWVLKILFPLFWWINLKKFLLNLPWTNFELFICLFSVRSFYRSFERPTHQNILTNYTVK